MELRLEGADDIPQRFATLNANDALILSLYATGSGVVEVVGTKLNGSCIKIMRGTSLGDDFGNSFVLLWHITNVR